MTSLEEVEQEGSFSEFLRAISPGLSSKDPRHVRLAAVTTAIVDVVAVRRPDDSGEAPTTSCPASQVYAKAVTALEGTLRNGLEASNVETQGALLELLEGTVRYVTPPAILAATLPLSSRVLRAVVALNCDSMDSKSAEVKGAAGSNRVEGSNGVLRWTCRATAQLLFRLAPGDVTRQIDNSTIKELIGGTFLTLLEDRRPKVRKAAQGALTELLERRRNLPDSICLAGIRKSVTDYIRYKLTTARRDLNLSIALHTLALLESIIPLLDYTKLCEDVMELFMALVDSNTHSAPHVYVALTKVKESTPKVLTVSATLSVICAIFRDVSDAREGLDQLAPRVLASLLRVNPLLVYRSGSAEFDILQRGRTLYGQAVLVACDHVAKSNGELACKLLPVSIQLLVLLSRPPDEQPNDASVSDTVMVELVQLLRSQLPGLVGADSPNSLKCLEDMLQAMERLLDTTYRPTWSTSLMSLAVLLTHLHSRVNVVVTVHAFLGLRNQVAAGSAAQQAIQESFSALVQGVGIDVCWKWIDWQTKNPDGSAKPGIGVDAVWVLSALKSAAMVAQPRRPQLSFFQSHVLSLARECDKVAATSKRDSVFHRSRVLDLWALLPAFCNHPCDISMALPTLATTLSRAIVDKRYPQLVTTICGGLRILCETFHWEASSGDHEDGSDCFVMSQAAVHLLPVLFKLVSDSSPSNLSNAEQDMMQIEADTVDNSTGVSVSSEHLQHVVDAIAALVIVAPKSYLQSLFKKLMHRVVDSMQSDATDSERLCPLLSLSQGLVSARVLEDSEVSLLYRTLKPLIRNDSHGARVQKRAYKVIAELCEKHHAFVTERERLKELTTLFTDTMMTSPVSARYMRLKCMNVLVDGFDGNESGQLSEVLEVCPELLLCLKDSNAKTRDAAYQLIISIASRVGAYRFLTTIAAALAGETPHMRSAAVMAFSRIVFEFGWDDFELQAHLPTLLRTLLALIDEDSREVIKSVIGFIRICVAAIQAEQLKPLAPDIVTSLLKYQKAKSRFRSKVKIILKKLLKLFGYDFIYTLVPESESKLLVHMKKEEQRQKRKKEQGKQEKPRSSDFDEMLESDEEGSGDDGSFLSGATRFSRLTGREDERKGASGSAVESRTAKQLSLSSRKSRASSAASILLPNEKDGVIVDMLSSSIARRVKFAEDEIEDEESDGGLMEFDEDGRLVVLDDDDGHSDDAKLVEADDMNKTAKRRRTDNATQVSSRQSNGNRRAKSTRQGNQLGAAYRSKRAGGDVKRKDQKLEPYAYVPLDGRSYAKKHRRAAVEQMASIVNKGGKRKRGSR